MSTGPIIPGPQAIRAGMESRPASGGSHSRSYAPPLSRQALVLPRRAASRSCRRCCPRPRGCCPCPRGGRRRRSGVDASPPGAHLDPGRGRAGRAVRPERSTRSPRAAVSTQPAPTMTQPAPTVTMAFWLEPSSDPTPGASIVCSPFGLGPVFPGDETSSQSHVKRGKKGSWPTGEQDRNGCSRPCPPTFCSNSIYILTSGGIEKEWFFI